MSRNQKAALAGVLILSALVCLVVALPRTASSQEAPRLGELWASPNATPEEEKLAGGDNFTITVFASGRPLVQRDTNVGEDIHLQLKPGLYEVRMEGPGWQTFVKREVLVSEVAANILRPQVHPGTGCRVWDLTLVNLPACPKGTGHTSASPDQWKLCPVCGQQLQ